MLGGTSLFGGEGGIPRTIVGVLTLSVLRVGLDKINWIDNYLRTFLLGVVLLACTLLTWLALCVRRWRHRSFDRPEHIVATIFESSFAGIVFSSFTAAAVALSMVLGAYSAEVMRAAARQMMEKNNHEVFTLMRDWLVKKGVA